MAKKKTPEEAPKKVDLQKRSLIEDQIAHLLKEKDAVSEEIALVSKSENDPTEIPVQVLYNLTNRRTMLEKQITELRTEISTNCFIEEGEAQVDDDVISVGSVVTILCEFDKDDVETVTRRLVATNPQSNAPIEQISTESPLGRAIHKKKVGDRVEVFITHGTTTVSYFAVILSKE